MADKFRVQRTQLSIPLVHGAGVTTVTSPSTMINGVLWLIKVKTGAVDAAATITLNIIDVDGDVVYTKAAIAGNGTNMTNLIADNRVPLSGFYTVQMVFSAAQTATDNTAVITLIVDRG